MTTGFLRDPRSWLFGFVQTPDLPEKLVLGREREFLGWVSAAIAFNLQAIGSRDLKIIEVRLHPSKKSMKPFGKRLLAKPLLRWRCAY